MSDRDILWHAVHLDIDQSKGNFIRSSELDHILNQLETSDIIETTDTISTPDKNANFFGKLPEPILTNPNQYLHKAWPAKINYETLSPHFAFQSNEIINQTLKRTT